VKLFRCQACGQILHFENTRCENCGRSLGYLPEVGLLSALEPEAAGDAAIRARLADLTHRPEVAALLEALPSAGGGDAWHAWVRPDRLYRFCANAEHGACNWLVDAAQPDAYCVACCHNRTVPDLTVPRNLLLWRKLEIAKHRLFYTLIRLRLPLQSRAEDQDRGLAFDFLADAPDPAGPKVMTGHENGLITIRVEEADDAERERMRLAMGETYRTLLGHVRHEVGHWFWEVLVRDGGEAVLAAFRALFGDERQDYAAALQAHYDQGPPPGWPVRFVTAYAAAHPWEDWAETWAHYLHIVDTLETAGAYGVRIRPRIAPGDPALSAEVDFDPHAPGHAIEALVGEWLPLTFAVNGLNRSMGQPDLYPFVLSAPAVEKLGFVHRLVHGERMAPAAAA
jgi:hypothetical protein